MISFFFPGESPQFVPPCLDACDANDDGRVDLADSVFVLRFLFQFGGEPAAPGPFQPGPDPTADELGCTVGGVCG